MNTISWLKIIGISTVIAIACHHSMIPLSLASNHDEPTRPQQYQQQNTPAKNHQPSQQSPSAKTTIWDTFQLENPDELSSVDMHIRTSLPATIYINNQEVTSINQGNGCQAASQTSYTTYPIDLSILREGTNIVTAEISEPSRCRGSSEFELYVSRTKKDQQGKEQMTPPQSSEKDSQDDKTEKEHVEQEKDQQHKTQKDQKTPSPQKPDHPSKEKIHEFIEECKFYKQHFLEEHGYEGYEEEKLKDCPQHIEQEEPTKSSGEASPDTSPSKLKDPSKKGSGIEKEEPNKKTSPEKDQDKQKTQPDPEQADQPSQSEEQECKCTPHTARDKVCVKAPGDKVWQCTQ